MAFKNDGPGYLNGVGRSVRQFLLRYILAMAALCAFGLTATAATQVGETETVVRRVTGEVEDQLRKLAAKDAVYLDEQVQTQLSSASKLTFLDDTRISVGPNTRMTLDRYVFDPNANTGAMDVKVAKGVMRFITGKLSRKNQANYQVSTPTAALAIRGTTFELVVGFTGRTAVILRSASQIDISTINGQTGTLSAPGSAAAISPSGNLTILDNPPGWAVAQVDKMDTLFETYNRLRPNRPRPGEGDTPDFDMDFATDPGPNGSTGGIGNF